jgi:hypothetical protein
MYVHICTKNNLKNKIQLITASETLHKYIRARRGQNVRGKSY